MLCCVVFGGNSLSFGLRFKFYVSGTSDDRGKQRRDRAHSSDFMIFDFGIL